MRATHKAPKSPNTHLPELSDSWSPFSSHTQYPVSDYKFSASSVSRNCSMKFRWACSNELEWSLQASTCACIKCLWLATPNPISHGIFDLSSHVNPCTIPCRSRRTTWVEKSKRHLDHERGHFFLYGPRFRHSALDVPAFPSKCIPTFMMKFCSKYHYNWLF